MDAIGEFVSCYNYEHYHESLKNVTPANINYGSQELMVKERELIKKEFLNIRSQLFLKEKTLFLNNETLYDQNSTFFTTNNPHFIDICQNL